MRRARGRVGIGALPALLVLLAVAACVDVRYATRATRVEPRAGEALVYGRLRFFHDGKEFHPWVVTLWAPENYGIDVRKHVYLLRLTRRAVSAELHPDEDGSLTIWIAPADYALVGTMHPGNAAAYEVLALLRVPAGTAAVYAGDLIMKTHTPPEGGHLEQGDFGTTSVVALPIAEARSTIEKKAGSLPAAPVSSPWCVTDDLPRFQDSDLAERGIAILDGGCRDRRWDE